MNWLGSSPSELQLLSLVKVNLSEEWRNATTDLNWDRGTMKGLYSLMDLKLEIYWPSLKRIVDLLTSLKKAPHESHIQFLERVQKKMLTGGVGSKNNFSLDWDKLLIVLILKGLPVGDTRNLLKCLLKDFSRREYLGAGTNLPPGVPLLVFLSKAMDPPDLLSTSGG